MDVGVLFLDGFRELAPRQLLSDAQHPAGSIEKEAADLFSAVVIPGLPLLGGVPELLFVLYGRLSDAPKRRYIGGALPLAP